jgi:hypothetical protein
MSERVTLELPEGLALQARALAARTDRRIEEVLLEWIDRAAPEPALEMLTDEELLSDSGKKMSASEEEELNDLLDRNREGQLQVEERSRLDEIMGSYRRGLVRKARALKLAAERGLRPRLDHDSAPTRP